MANGQNISLNVVGLYCYKTIGRFEPDKTSIADILKDLREGESPLDFSFRGNELTLSYTFTESSELSPFVATNRKDIKRKNRSTIAWLGNCTGSGIDFEWDLEITGIFDKSYADFTGEVPFEVNDLKLDDINRPIIGLSEKFRKFRNLFEAAIRNKKFRIVFRATYRPFPRPIRDVDGQEGLIGVNFYGFDRTVYSCSFPDSDYLFRTKIQRVLDRVKSSSDRKFGFDWKPLKKFPEFIGSINIKGNSIPSGPYDDDSKIVWQFYRYCRKDRDSPLIRLYTPPALNSRECRANSFRVIEGRMPQQAPPYIVQQGQIFVFFRPIKINF